MKFGIAFSETIGKKTRREGRTGGLDEVFGDESLIGRVETEKDYFAQSINPWRVLVFPIVLSLCVLLLFSKLFKLQIVEGERNLALSNGNRIMVKVVHAPRGVIYDRNGKVVVRNVPAFRLFKEASCEKGESRGWGEKTEFCSGYKLISREEALALEAKGGEEAKRLEVDTLRQYIYPEAFAHVLGYTGELTEEELKAREAEGKNYVLGDRVGRTGIEEEYEDVLRGKDGKELFEVDAGGNIIRELGKIEPKDGESVSLTIDSDLQRLAYEALGNNKGTVIASDPTSGEILAMASKPSFDPNVFTIGDSFNELSALLSDEKNTPLVNRAIAGVYPPGSTFKLVVASGALEDGKISEKTEIIDNGEIAIGQYKFPNWYFKQYGKTEGSLNVIRAIKRSNDIFFYKTAEALGIERLSFWAKTFGLSEKLGIDLPSEASGLFPSDAWKQKVIGDKWYLGDTYHLGIGQGYLLVTPLQILNWANVIANLGKTSKLHVARTEASFKSPLQERLISRENAMLIRKGMVEACEPGGTGMSLINFKVASEKLKAKIDGENFKDGGEGKIEVSIACKTGTAEYGDPKGKTHALVTLFAPAYDPTISITVLVEGGGEGSVVAAPIAKKVLEEWFK